jgi:hypothetical protein
MIRQLCGVRHVKNALCRPASPWCRPGAVRTFCTSSSRADTARTRRRLLRLCARSRSAPRARRAAGARHGVVVVPWLRPGEGSAHFAEPPPSVKPAACPDPSGPSAHRSLSSDHRRGERVMSGGAGRIGSKRLDPGAIRLLGRPLPAGHRPAVGDARFPLPPSQSQMIL